MDETILVVGATGMLGEPVAKKLHTDGYRVRLLCRKPGKAAEKFGEEYEIIQGDVEEPDTLERALEGCYGVHVNLAGGPTPADFDRIEHRGTTNVAKAAAMQGVQRITYLSGSSVCEENAWFYTTKAKIDAEAAIRSSGVAYTIFRCSWFMESLPMFVRGKKASVIGKQPHPFHWLAAKDYAGMVSRSYRMAEAANKTLTVFGPEAMTMRDALESYCSVLQPDVKVSGIPIRLFSLIAGIKRDAFLKHVARLIAYFERTGDIGDPTETNELFGAPATTLDEWCKERCRVI